MQKRHGLVGNWMDLPCELRARLYYESDSHALLCVSRAWRLQRLWPYLPERLPPRARAKALRHCELLTTLLVQNLSQQALEDLLGDDHLNADEEWVARVAQSRPGLLYTHTRRIGPGVEDWHRAVATPIPRHVDDVVGTFYLAGTGNSRVFSALLGGGIVEWDTRACSEVRRFAPRIMVCCLAMAACGTQLAVGQTNGKVALYSLKEQMWRRELQGGPNMVRCIVGCGPNLVIAACNWGTLTLVEGEQQRSCPGQGDLVRALVAWGTGHVVCAEDSGAIWMCDTLQCSCVCVANAVPGTADLAVHRESLFSLHWTGHLHVWSLTGGLQLQHTVRVTNLMPGSSMTYLSLQVCGTKLICGGTNRMCVLDLATLCWEHTVCVEGVVRPLLATRAELLAIVTGKEMRSQIVVWR
jgi:hypothetical protein